MKLKQEPRTVLELWLRRANEHPELKEELARLAGTTPEYLRHLSTLYRENPGVILALDIVKAANFITRREEHLELPILAIEDLALQNPNKQYK